MTIVETQYTILGIRNSIPIEFSICNRSTSSDNFISNNVADNIVVGDEFKNIYLDRIFKSNNTYDDIQSTIVLKKKNSLF